MRGRGSRRALLKFLVVPLVLILFVLLYLDVEVSRRFDGRLWDDPSQIYSDRLRIRPRDPIRAEALARRLLRAGYAEVPTTPAHAGQFRRSPGTLDTFLRAFNAPTGVLKERRVVFRFADGTLQSITDGSGRFLPRAEIEPELLATLHGPRQEERQVLSLPEVPDAFLAALLAAEDVRFFDHHGVDPVAIARASLKNVRQGRIVQGGSTLTQQLVKNLYLNQEKSWWRKGREAVLATILEFRYPKNRILEAYLNHVYLGQRGPVAICGVQAGARFYFGRDLADLSQGEMALLAGIIRNPGGYNPFLHPDRALERRGQVLEAMVRVGTLEAAQAQAAQRETLRLGSGAGGFGGAPYVVDFVRSQLSELYSDRMLEEGGLRIFTSIDTLLQENAEAVLDRGLEALERNTPALRRQAASRRLQGCVLAIEPRTGAVLALVGGRDYRSSQFNRAVQARRQPGSCFKPFVYLAGFEAGILGRDGALTTATVLEDEPIDLVSGGKRWQPENYDGKFRGSVSVRQSLEASLNVPTVRAAQQVGLRYVVEIAERCGLTPRLKALPSVALGAQEVSPLELATAYGTLAAGGTRTDPAIVRAVTGPDGKTISGHEPKRVAAVSPQAAYLVTDVLRGVLTQGTAAASASLGFRGDAAGKTGTTDDTKDAWFVGYTPDLLALVWVGYDDNAKTGLTGAAGALPIWTDFMMRSRWRWETRGFVEPSGLMRVRIDPVSGELATGSCPDSTEELFAEGTEPEEECHLHGSGVLRWFRRLWSKEPEKPKHPV